MFRAIHLIERSSVEHAFEREWQPRRFREIRIAASTHEHRPLQRTERVDHKAPISAPAYFASSIGVTPSFALSVTASVVRASVRQDLVTKSIAVGKERKVLTRPTSRVKCRRSKNDGGIAQLVERLVRNEKVRGSNPLTSINFAQQNSLNLQGMRTCSTGGARSAWVTSEALDNPLTSKKFRIPKDIKEMNRENLG